MTSDAQDRQDQAPDAHPPAGEPASPLPTGDGAPIDPAAEEDLWSGRMHWKHFAGRLILWGLACILIGVLLGWINSSQQWWGFWKTAGIILAIVLVSGAVMAVIIGIKVLGTRYRVTTQRLFVEKGILTKTVDQLELIRVDDVRMFQGILDRIFGLGTVIVLTTDATHHEVKMVGIGEPVRVSEAIRQNMRALRRKSLFVENL